VQKRQETAARKTNVVIACAGLGAGYGAVYGGLWTSFATNDDCLLGALCGALLGVLTGGGIGAFGLLVGNWLGWRLTAILGGLAPGCALFGLAWWVSEPGGVWSAGELVSLAAPAMIAAVVGIAVALGLRTGRSRVPGVQSVVEAVNEVRARPQHGKRPAVSAELVPARAPEGRGDEPSPSGMPPARLGGEA
jgi:hypothetical protein